MKDPLKDWVALKQGTPQRIKKNQYQPPKKHLPPQSNRSVSERTNSTDIPGTRQVSDSDDSFLEIPGLLNMRLPLPPAPVDIPVPDSPPEWCQSQTSTLVPISFKDENCLETAAFTRRTHAQNILEKIAEDSPDEWCETQNWIDCADANDVSNHIHLQQKEKEKAQVTRGMAPKFFQDEGGNHADTLGNFVDDINFDEEKTTKPVCKKGSVVSLKGHVFEKIKKLASPRSAKKLHESSNPDLKDTCAKGFNTESNKSENIDDIYSEISELLSDLGCDYEEEQMITVFVNNWSCLIPFKKDECIGWISSQVMRMREQETMPITVTGITDFYTGQSFDYSSMIDDVLLPGILLRATVK